LLARQALQNLGTYLALTHSNYLSRSSSSAQSWRLAQILEQIKENEAKLADADEFDKVGGAIVRLCCLGGDNKRAGGVYLSICPPWLSRVAHLMFSLVLLSFSQEFFETEIANLKLDLRKLRQQPR
jgi:hypothetical protein